MGEDKLKNKQISKINLDNNTYRSSFKEQKEVSGSTRPWWAVVWVELKVVRELDGQRHDYLGICRS